MALGDLAVISGVNASLDIGLTLTCPNCGVKQTTPTVHEAGTLPPGQSFSFYANYVCTNCGKPLLVAITIEGFQAAAQQTQP